MSGFLVASEGPLAGLIIRMDDGHEWIIGRDPDVSFQVLEDPMVSRRHAKVQLIDDQYFLENLSSVNPASVNGINADEPIQLTENDTVQIGGTLFRFTEEDPTGRPSPSPEIPEETDQSESEPQNEEPIPDLMTAFRFRSFEDARWVVKVISGPNSGAEFALHPATTSVLGKDPEACDIALQDLSVSRQHARFKIDAEGNTVSIEDLGSRNGTLINGRPIEGEVELQSQDLIALGTTSLLIIDREQTRETIYSPPTMVFEPEEAEEALEPKDWKKMVIPKHHLILAGIFCAFVLVGVGSLLALFRAEPIVVEHHDHPAEIRKAIANFPAVEFSFNEATGKIFLLGHVMTEVDHQELSYSLSTLPFITSVEDNVITDELVWDNINALLIKNPNWRSVSMVGHQPGIFLLRGYVDTADEDAELKEYLNLNFNYLNKLENQVVVEKTLEMQVQVLLISEGFTTITMQLTGGDLILAGRVPKNEEKKFNHALDKLRRMHGIASVNSLVIFTSEQTARINLTERYRVTGTSKVGNVPQYVVIGGRILSSGDTLDGMTITAIEPEEILLEKDGLKYKINYNEQ